MIGPPAVLFVEQTLTSLQKAQAATNIGLGTLDNVQFAAIVGTTITATTRVAAPNGADNTATLTFSDTPGAAGLRNHATLGSQFLYIVVNGADRWVLGDTVLQALDDAHIVVGLNSSTVAAYGNRIDGGPGLGFPSSTTCALQAGGNYILTISSTAARVNTGYVLILPTSTPASASATGVAGTITWDASFIYVCTATDTWKRVAIATW